MAFYLLGIIFLFDRAILIIANILFIIGMVQMIGFGGTVAFFTKPRNIKKSVVFFIGLFIMAVLRWAFVGAIVQLYSLFLLFKGFMPILWEWIFNIPGVGPWVWGCLACKADNHLSKIQARRLTHGLAPNEGRGGRL